MRKTAVVFYSVTIGDWESRTKRALTRIINSGLYEEADELYLVISDTDGTHQQVIGQLAEEFPRFMVEYHLQCVDSEHNGIMRAQEVGRREGQEYNILYLHAKGVSNQYKTIATKDVPYELKTAGVRTWTDMMEYFLVDRWKECVRVLDEGIDTTGVKNYGGWWWGNFWWATSEHIKKTRPFEGGSRWDCEAWLHDWHPNKEEIKYHEWFSYQYHPYFTDLPSYLWDYSDKSDIIITIRRILCGCFGEQTDEGRPEPCPEKTVDITEEFSGTFDGKKFAVHPAIGRCGPDVCVDPPQVRIFYHTSREPTIERTATSHHGTFPYITLMREE